MKILSIDYGGLVQKLQGAGFTEEQAEALVTLMLRYVAYPQSTDRDRALSVLCRSGFVDEQASALVDVFEARQRNAHQE